MIRKILGPPGTGKTTKLIGNKELKVPGYVSTFLKLGTPLNRIGYFAFTRQAANEAKERMLKLYPQYGYRELENFRTLHSLAFWKLGMKKENVMQPEDYEKIGEGVGVEVTVYTGGQEETGYIDSDSEYFNLINIARIRNRTLKEEYDTDLYSDDLDYGVLKIIKDELNSYKHIYHLKDYTDMIEEFISKISAL